MSVAHVSGIGDKRWFCLKIDTRSDLRNYSLAFDKSVELFLSEQNGNYRHLDWFGLYYGNFSSRF